MGKRSTSILFLKSEAILSALDSENPAQRSAFCAHTTLLRVSDHQGCVAQPYKFRNPRLGGSRHKPHVFSSH